jgi:hypothetical protein
MDEIIVGKEGSLINKQNSLKNLLREQNQLEEQVKMIKDNLALMAEKKALFKRNAEISQASEFKFLKPAWSFEEDPEYVANLKRLNAISNQEKEIEFDKQIKTVENLSKNVSDQLVSVSNEVTRIKSELEKLEGDLK